MWCVCVEPPLWQLLQYINLFSHSSIQYLLFKYSIEILPQKLRTSNDIWQINKHSHDCARLWCCCFPWIFHRSYIWSTFPLKHLIANWMRINEFKIAWNIVWSHLHAHFKYRQLKQVQKTWIRGQKTHFHGKLQEFISSQFHKILLRFDKISMGFYFGNLAINEQFMTSFIIYRENA